LHFDEVRRMILRPYQQRTVDLIRDSLRQGNRRILVTLPTGSGKSIIMGCIARSCIDKGSRVLALMHRRQLVDQLGDRFESCGVNSGTVMSGIGAELHKPVQIGTVQTYSRRQGFEEVDWDSGDTFRPWEHPADVIMIDECHRSLARTFQDILKAYDGKIVLGFTATPALSSGVAMGSYWQTLIQPVSVRELIDCGALVAGVYYGLSAPDLAGLKIVAGDYEKKGLSERVKAPKIIGDIVENWLRVAAGKKTMVFAVNVKHSKAIVHEFCRFGIAAEHLDAHSDDEKRDAALGRFRSGETTVMSNVGLFTEGTDIPEIECICLARPTKSIGVYLQMVGRGARPAPGKASFVVLDHGKNINEHGFYEEPVGWTLDGKKITYTKPAPREPKEKHKMICKMCSAVFTGDRCPECYTEVEDYGKKVEHLEAELKRMDEGRKETKGAQFRKLQPAVLIGMLKSEASRMGKSDSWIRANYKNIVDRWPKNLDVRELPATDELRSYLAYLRIKWIKGQQKKKLASVGWHEHISTRN
jgi:superfamily II DNA or RNA helicase